VHPVRDVLQRADRFLARLALEEPQIGELEQRDRGREPLGRARAEELPRLVQHDDAGQLSLEAHAAQREPADVAVALEREQRGELVRVVGEVHEGRTGRDGDPLAGRQVVERRIEPLVGDAITARHEPVDEHLAPRVVAHERDLGEPVDFRQRVSEREERRVDVWGDAERVSERGEGAWRHPPGRGAAAERGGAESCRQRAAKVNHANANRASFAQRVRGPVLLDTPPSPGSFRIDADSHAAARVAL
jgi:hypothetical protein